MVSSLLNISILSNNTIMYLFIGFCFGFVSDVYVLEGSNKVVEHYDGFVDDGSGNDDLDKNQCDEDSLF